LIVEGKVPFDIIRYVYSAAALWHSDFHPPSADTIFAFFSFSGGHVPLGSYALELLGRPSEVTYPVVPRRSRTAMSDSEEWEA
jgi:hypothetical protein